MAEESYKTLEPIVKGLKRRFDVMECRLRILGCDNSKMTGSHLVSNFPGAHFMEDVPHVLRRFQGCVDVRKIGEAYGPLCGQLAFCFYIVTAGKRKDGPAIYRDKEDQATLLTAWYERWKDSGAFRTNQPAQTDIEDVYRTQLQLVNEGACSHNCEFVRQSI
jgi:hypothetical protein